MSLSRLEGDLLSALEDLPVAAYLLDEHRRIRWMNAAAMRMFGDLRGRHAEAAVVPEDVNLVRKVATRKLIGQAQTTEFEARFVLADGSVIAAEVSSVALKGDRHVVGIFGLIRQFRQAKPAERRLIPPQLGPGTDRAATSMIERDLGRGSPPRRRPARRSS